MTKTALNPCSKPADAVPNPKDSIAGIDLPLAYKALIGAYVRVQRNAGKVDSKSVNLDTNQGIAQHEESTLQGPRTSRV